MFTKLLQPMIARNEILLRRDLLGSDSDDDAGENDVKEEEKK